MGKRVQPVKQVGKGEISGLLHIIDRGMFPCRVQLRIKNPVSNYFFGSVLLSISQHIKIDCAGQSS